MRWTRHRKPVDIRTLADYVDYIDGRVTYIDLSACQTTLSEAAELFHLHTCTCFTCTLGLAPSKAQVCSHVLCLLLSERVSVLSLAN